MSQILDLKRELLAFSTPEKSKKSTWFFKTGSGQYGEGDIFIGVTVPEVRKTIKNYLILPIIDVEQLLHSKEHEFRLAALLILIIQFETALTASKRKEIFDLYLSNTSWINNWDLVDTSAGHIVGGYLENRSKNILLKLAGSKSLWERRIAMIATFEYIKKGDAEQAFIIAKILLNDKHDLIQKAVGWMLREIGKRCSEEKLLCFLDQYHLKMPRTMLRYAIERLSLEQKTVYMLRKSIL